MRSTTALKEKKAVAKVLLNRGVAGDGAVAVFMVFLHCKRADFGAGVRSDSCFLTNDFVRLLQQPFRDIQPKFLRGLVVELKIALSREDRDGAGRDASEDFVSLLRCQFAHRKVVRRDTEYRRIAFYRIQDPPLWVFGARLRSWLFSKIRQEFWPGARI